MLRRNSVFLAVLVVAVAVSASVAALAQEKADSSDQAARIVRYVDEQTIVVARLDIAGADVDAILDQLSQVIPEARKQLEPQKPLIKALRQSFVAMGGREVFGVVNVADIRGGPFALIPINKEGDPAALAALISQTLIPTGRGGPAIGQQVVCQPLEDRVLFIGITTTLARLKRSKPAPRPELAKALQAITGDAVLKIVFLPSDDHRRVIAETLPELPAELGGGPSRPWHRNEAGIFRFDGDSIARRRRGECAGQENDRMAKTPRPAARDLKSLPAAGLE